MLHKMEIEMTNQHHKFHQQYYKVSNTYVVMELHGISYGGHFELISRILKKGPS